MELFICRFSKGEKQTLGTFTMVDADKTIIMSGMTLELPDKDNLKMISCIPSGVYTVKKRYSLKFGWHFHIQKVVNRSYILIHAGNYNTDIMGCILVGQYLTDINNDGMIDIANSKATLKIMLSLLPPAFLLTISTMTNEINLK